MAWQEDHIENRGAALIQHGPYNNRIYLMKLGDSDVPSLLDDLNALAAEKGYTKIFARIPAGSADAFIKDGFVLEAKALGLMRRKEDCLFLGKFINPLRKLDTQALQHEKVLGLVTQGKAGGDRQLRPGYLIRRCTGQDAAEMCRVYARIYDSYPFPIDREAYIVRTMRDQVDYYCVEHGGAIVALASMEADKAGQCVEMSDFATMEEFRGEGLASLLLTHMEKEAALMCMKSSYTIARAISPGMNIAFARRGYDYCGRLVNNTQISGQIESMNVWSKALGG